MDTGAVADTLMSALTRVQTALAPPPDTAGDAEYAAQVEDDLHWLEQWQSTCDAALAASLAPPDTTGDAALAASLAPPPSDSITDGTSEGPRSSSCCKRRACC